MMRVSQLVISLPLFFAAIQFAVPGQANAQAMDPMQATTLLAKSNALNLKCNILGDAEGQQLRDFVARAEISLAEKVSVSAARKAIAAGREEAKAAACDEINRKSVGDVLAAAKTAVETPAVGEAAVEPEKNKSPVAVVETKKPETTALAVAETAPAPKPVKVVAKAPKPIQIPKQVAVIKPQKPAGRVKTVENGAVAKPAKGKTKGKLSGYAQVAENYYAAMKCGNVSRGKLVKMYKSVLASHQEALANNRPRDVKVMLRNAEARAGVRACS